MAKRRQIVLMNAAAPTSEGMAPLGSLRQVTEILGRFNTATDGTPPSTMGTLRLFGPGMVVELPQGFDNIAQAMVTLVEEEIAWSVLSRLCKEKKWKMVDLETGRAFG